MPRVLILTASVGEGHDLPARTLADQLRLEDPAVDVRTEDGLVAMGPLVGAVSEGAPRIVFYRFRWLWDLGFWFFAGFGPTRRLTQHLLTRIGAPGLLRLVRTAAPDVIVSTYPQTTEVLARLRRSGRLEIPLCAAITDVSALRYWAAPGVDIHLVTHPESIDEVRSIAGADTRVECVHGFTVPEFLLPRDRVAARTGLGLPAEGKIVLVSGGGWGVGDIQSAVSVALDADDVSAIVCLCGRNDELLARLERRFAGERRVRVEGFTERMSDWMAAADALVHSTGGLTVLEALIRGCPAISYGWGRGHVRVQNAAFRRFGLAEVAATPEALATALRGALSVRRPPATEFAALPSAASFVLAEARGRASA